MTKENMEGQEETVIKKITTKKHQGM